MVGAHPGRGKCPIWELLFQSIQLGGSLVFPRKIVGSNGHSDRSFRLFFRDLEEKISYFSSARKARTLTDPKILAKYHLETWSVIPAILGSSHLYFYPELPCRGLESMGIKYKVVPSFTRDWGAIAKRPLRKCRPFVGSDVEWHMAWSCTIRGRKNS